MKNIRIEYPGTITERCAIHIWELEERTEQGDLK